MSSVRCCASPPSCAPMLTLLRTTVARISVSSTAGGTCSNVGGTRICSCAMAALTDADTESPSAAARISCALPSSTTRTTPPTRHARRPDCAGGAVHSGGGATGAGLSWPVSSCAAAAPSSSSSSSSSKPLLYLHREWFAVRSFQARVGAVSGKTRPLTHSV